MQSHMSIGFIFLIIGGLLGKEFCYNQYCYITDGELKSITSLKDAQDICTNSDSSSWLLEIYDSVTYLKVLTQGFTNPILYNIFGTVVNAWTSVTNGQLPTGVTVDETNGKDFVYLFLNEGTLSFFGTDKSYESAYICRVAGNCPGGYCYQIYATKLSWFRSESYCYTNQFAVDKDYGHLATFDGMTYDEISKLSFVSQMTDLTPYWIGYSKLLYTWQHANNRSFMLVFDNPDPLTTASFTGTVLPMYYVYLDIPSKANKERVTGSDQFQIICMRDNSPTTTVKQTSTTAITSSATAGRTSVTITPVSATTGRTSVTITPVSESTIILSLVLPTLLWLVFAISFIWCILPFCVNRKIKNEKPILE